MHPTPQAVRIRGNHLVRQLRELNLNPDDYVIFGSAPLFAHGLRDTLRDLDVVARGDVLRAVAAAGTPARATYSGDPIWQFHGGRLQFSADWITRTWDTDALIDNAELIDGLRFASLRDVLRYKEQLRRPKDEADIVALHAHLAANAAGRTSPSVAGPAGC